jgi:hypothetical protein
METVPFMRWCGKILQSWAGHRWQYSTWALHDGYLRLQTHTHNILYLLLFHGNNGSTNVPWCHITHTLPVLLVIANRIYNQDVWWEAEKPNWKLPSQKTEDILPFLHNTAMVT